MRCIGQKVGYAVSNGGGYAGLESVRYGVSNVLDTAYWGFLGVGTTHRYTVSSLMDTAYWSSEHSTIRPKRNSKSDTDKSEAQELVRTLLKSFSYDKTLISTLNKYVKLVRTEHCFLLFEELGKSEKWLQCFVLRQSDFDPSSSSWNYGWSKPNVGLCFESAQYIFNASIIWAYWWTGGYGINTVSPQVGRSSAAGTTSAARQQIWNWVAIDVLFSVEKCHSDAFLQFIGYLDKHLLKEKPQTVQLKDGTLGLQNFQNMICSRYRVLTTATISASYVGNDTDFQALLSFKSMITQDPHGALTSWNDSFHFCDWSGVSCGKRHRRVTALYLGSQGFEGSLSPYVGNLSFLRELVLVNNSLDGTIPHELGRLSRLRLLVFQGNKFNGSISANLSGCFNLRELRLSRNELVGSIPKELSFLSKLTVVSLSRNNLTGGVPPFLGNITSMEVFSVNDNPLGGSIPATLGHWKNLRVFTCGGCELYGTIPHSIYNLSLLTNFSLADNELTGSLSLEIGAMLPSIEYLQLHNNQLTGVLPPSISNCSKLKALEMGENNFSRKLDISFAKLRDIFLIHLNSNNLHGRGEGDDMKFIESLRNCSKLKFLDLYNCSFQGVLPNSIGNLSNQLSFINLGENELYGNVPSSVGNLVGLKTLELGGNQFTGKIPTTIGMLQRLQYVGLSVNKFFGPIPDAIGNLSLLNTLRLASNRLGGHIPSSLGNCLNLLDISLFDNKLSGKIPKEIFQLPSLSIRLQLSRNQLSGSLPTEVGNLKMLTYLNLSDNNLSGNIPNSLGDCTSLSFLSIKANSFIGMIPSSLRTLKGLVVLDLSHNNLSGQIPQFLEQILLQYINLSFNDFEGKVPVAGVFAKEGSFSVLGNSQLCGGLVGLGLPKCKETKKHKKKFPLFVVVIIIASILFVVSCFVYVWCKKRNKGLTSQIYTNERFLKVSYDQLLKATDGFSEANMIGEGGFSSVYKGILNTDKFVAVKVLNLQNLGAQRSFMRECEAWRSIRHRNLLKIITLCSSVDFQGNDFKALVYEFMPKGSLHDWLHSNENKSRLNLLQRINILMDVACALEYLHNCCQTTIVHGDLKPSNILLDDDMVAHVGDFGLARFLGTDTNQNSSTGVKGTVGYAPPEYGLGSEMTVSGDVYSFGILLLEVMTGKKPTDDIFDEGLTLHKYAYKALPDHVIDAIDGDAIVSQSTKANAQKMEECLTSVVKIGVSCSVDSPPQRMNIENVVHELQHILDVLQNI
ncbi:kinase-like domain-containing protein [Tanacetum coccineum]|uniref:Kinase-like domain-containing protein n=1 Tax=Tanacetum coccineum TaxID=301880 RepID=A0ABQ5FMJ5_9ASTR